MTDNLEPRRIVHLVEDESGTEMEVYLEVDLDERTFGLLVPTDLAIDVVEVVDEDGDEMLRPLEVNEQKELRSEMLSDMLTAHGIDTDCIQNFSTDQKKIKPVKAPTESVGFNFTESRALSLEEKEARAKRREEMMKQRTLEKYNSKLEHWKYSNF